MIIDKKRVDGSLANVRRLYQQHTNGELGASDFVTKARAELNALYWQHTRDLIDATVSRVMEELHSFQTQLGLDLDCQLSITYVGRRGYKSIRASVHVRNKTYTHYSGSVTIYIGPFDEWTKIAVHSAKQRQEWKFPSFYTERNRHCWRDVQDFDFPELLQWIKEEVERPAPEPGEDEDDVAF